MLLCYKRKDQKMRYFFVPLILFSAFSLEAMEKPERKNIENLKLEASDLVFLQGVMEKAEDEQRSQLVILEKSKQLVDLRNVLTKAGIFVKKGVGGSIFIELRPSMPETMIFFYRNPDLLIHYEDYSDKFKLLSQSGSNEEIKAIAHYHLNLKPLWQELTKAEKIHSKYIRLLADDLRLIVAPFLNTATQYYLSNLKNIYVLYKNKMVEEQERLGYVDESVEHPYDIEFKDNRKKLLEEYDNNKENLEREYQSLIKKIKAATKTKKIYDPRYPSVELPSTLFTTPSETPYDFLPLELQKSKKTVKAITTLATAKKGKKVRELQLPKKEEEYPIKESKEEIISVPAETVLLPVSTLEEQPQEVGIDGSYVVKETDEYVLIRNPLTQADEMIYKIGNLKPVPLSYTERVLNFFDDYDAILERDYFGQHFSETTKRDIKHMKLFSRTADDFINYGIEQLFIDRNNRPVRNIVLLGRIIPWDDTNNPKEVFFSWGFNDNEQVYHRAATKNESFTKTLSHLAAKTRFDIDFPPLP